MEPVIDEEFKTFSELCVLRDKIKTLSVALLKISDTMPQPYAEIVYVFATEAIRSAADKCRFRDCFKSDEDYEYFTGLK